MVTGGISISGSRNIIIKDLWLINRAVCLAHPQTLIKEPQEKTAATLFQRLLQLAHHKRSQREANLLLLDNLIKEGNPGLLHLLGLTISSLCVSLTIHTSLVQ